LEQNLRAHRDSAIKNTQGFKQKLGELNTQKSSLTEEKRQLEVKVSSLEQEITVLRAAQVPKTDAPPTSAAQTEEQNKLLVSFPWSATFLLTNKFCQADLRAERDKLLAEKDTWSKAAPAEANNANALGTWEAEKAQLIKARDEAVEKLKACLYSVYLFDF